MSPSWVNYFKAGMKVSPTVRRIPLAAVKAEVSAYPVTSQGALGYMSAQNSNVAIELHILVDGNVPPGGGLSSSAAMVVSSAIATLKAFKAIESTTQGELATIAIDSGESASL